MFAELAPQHLGAHTFQMRIFTKGIFEVGVVKDKELMVVSKRIEEDSRIGQIKKAGRSTQSSQHFFLKDRTGNLSLRSLNDFYSLLIPLRDLI